MTSATHFSRSMLAIALFTMGCAPAEAPLVPAQRAHATEDPSGSHERLLMPLLLETREGVGSQGWSFAEQGLVDAEEADLVLSSFDCGARGRWVTLEARGGVEICGSEEGPGCGDAIEIGGSNPAVLPGDTLFAVTGEGQIYGLMLDDLTATPFDWYTQEDHAFEVDLVLLQE